MTKLVKTFNSKRRAFVIFCDHHRMLGKIVWPVRWAWKKTGIGRALNDLEPERRKHYEIFGRSDELHKRELDKLSEMLEDDQSREILAKLLEHRRTRDLHILEELDISSQYFQKDIFGPAKDEVFVDGGAYVGDTIEDFMKFTGGGYKKIYAWEPDEGNLEVLKKNTKKYDRITYVPCGLWSKRTELHFIQNGSISSRIDDSDEGDTSGIKVDSIDNVCSGDKVTFIKMDIEGSEMEALKGAINVIRRDKPRLAICIYHKPQDLYEIPFWVKETVPEYKLYIRQHSYSWGETVLYATL